MLRKDIQAIKKSKKVFIPADKTRNFYKADKNRYEKMLRENITKSYKMADENAYYDINSEAKKIACSLDIDERMDTLAKRQAFITLKDHKENFLNNPTCRLINPTKSQMGIVSKQILDRINKSIRSSTAVNQWRNTASVINWFKGIPNKSKYKFIVFDIVNFYPSITEDILQKSINFAKQHVLIPDKDVEIIMHSRRSLLFDKELPWVKRDGKDMFDVTMGSYDGAEICELVGLYILDVLAQKYNKDEIGLYRDDGLAAFRNISGSKAERIKKDITKTFHDIGLKITIETNLKIVNFLDVTLDLSDGKFYPYRKPNDQPMYIHRESNHPPTIIKQLHKSISKRISTISSDKKIFDEAAPHYNSALKSSGHSETLTYMNENTGRNTRNRQRNIIWFNPPFSKSVQTNIGRTFLHLIDKHFPRSSKLRPIFNRGNLKISYSCMPNIANILKSHNGRILNQQDDASEGSCATPCNCRVKAKCPLSGNCQTSCIVYKAEAKSADGRSANYIGLTENAFKNRFSNHTLSFTHRKYEHSTELSKYIWKQRDKGQSTVISWSVMSHAHAYSNATTRCNLCLAEKLHIISADKTSLLNKRSELISKCRHRNRFYLSNFKTTTSNRCTHQRKHTPPRLPPEVGD